MINIATRFKAFRAFICIILFLPYWLGEPFKFDDEDYKYLPPRLLKQEYNRRYWDHFSHRIFLGFIFLSTLSLFITFVPFSLLILITTLVSIPIVCLMVDGLIWLCRIVYQKIDEAEKKIENEEFGEENFLVPLDYYKDTDFLVLMKKRIENEKKTREQNQSRINEFHQQRQNLSNGQPYD